MIINLKLNPMKKLAYLLIFVFASASLASCGGSSASCVESDKYIIKNMKFENQELVLSKKYKTNYEIINWFELNNKRKAINKIDGFFLF